MDGIHGNGASRPATARRYPVELPITFGEGAGLTRAVSREEVRFATDAALAAGQRLTGALRFPARDGEAAGTVLRYVVRVTGVRASGWDDTVSEVEARFERLELWPDLGPPGAA
jgi:hypothetical protein